MKHLTARVHVRPTAIGLALALLVVISVSTLIARRDQDRSGGPAPAPFLAPVSDRVPKELSRTRGRPAPQPSGLSVPGASVASESSAAAARGSSYIPGRVVVRYQSDTPVASRSRIREEIGLTILRRLPLPGTEVVGFRGDRSVEEVQRSLERFPEVAYAEPDLVYSASSVLPNDPRFAQLWGLQNAGDTDIDTPEAWAVTTGSTGVRVGVVDTGVAYDHPDLAPNIATNPGESGGGKETNGLDDDGNGFVDDFRGWDWVGRDNDPRDLQGHGSHVAGTIAAKGNNGMAVSGVGWDLGLVPLRVLDADGSGTSSNIAAAFAYAGAIGLDVVNASLGGPMMSQAVLDAINRSPNTLFVVAAGNESANNDVVPSYPCNLQAPNVVCVAATTQTDTLASFSNYGASSVDLAAPGSGIMSTVPVSVVAARESFESGFSDRWTSAGPGAGWGLGSDGSGGYLADSPAASYVPSTDSTILRVQPLDLSAATGCRARQALRLDTEQGADLVSLEASRDAETWTRVGAWSGSTGGRWAEVTAGLDSFSGSSSVYLRYRMTSNSNTVIGTGADIDDLEVRCVGTRYSGEEVATFSGTSMSSPHVAGAAAVIKSAVPNLTVAAVKAALLDGAVPIPALQGKTVTGGRLNVLAAMNEAGALPPPAVTPVPSPSPSPSPSVTHGANWGGTSPAPTPVATPTAPSPSPAATATPTATPTPVPSPSGEQTADPGRSLQLTLNRHLVAKVVVSAHPETCEQGVPIVIKRNGVLVAKTRTDSSGTVRTRLRDRVGRYVAVAPPLEECGRAKGSAQHRHSVAARGVGGEDEEIVANSVGSACYPFARSEKTLADLINGERERRGQATLRLDPELSHVARLHARDMASADVLAHSTKEELTTRLTGWSVLGQNVAVAEQVEELHALFMDFAAHRKNVLSVDFAHVGVGAVRRGDRVWVAAIFAAGDPRTPLKMPSC